MDSRVAAQAGGELLAATIRQLLIEASIEMNASDVPHLPESRAFLPQGKKVYISHLPRQRWKDTIDASAAARAAGLKPVPHIPVRLMPDAMTLSQTLRQLIEHAGIEEVLLVAGDYSQPTGPYSCVSEVLRSGVLGRCGLQRVSLAGHPEGHPQVALARIRSAEHEKVVLATQSGLEVTFLTQFFFEAAPFLSWTKQIRKSGARMRIVAGLSGPAPLTTLFRYAVRCGVGPSIRVLTARPTAIGKLLSGYGPDDVLQDLAYAHARDRTAFDGIHWFCFGGFLRTCQWLHALI